MDNQFGAGAAQAVQRAHLHIDDILRVGIIVDQPDQEGAPERQAARLRIRTKADAGDDFGDGVARLRVDAGGIIDDARNGLFGNAGQPRHIIDGGLLAAAENCFDRFRHRPPISSRACKSRRLAL